MSRTVTVRYLVPVYATVDIDAEPPAEPDGWYPDGAVPQVFVADGSISRQDNAEAMAAFMSGDVIETAYDDDAIDPATLTAEERARALVIVERAMWPMWMHG